MTEFCREVIKELSVRYWKNDIESEEVLVALCVFLSKNALSKKEVDLIIQHVFLQNQREIKQAINKANRLIRKDVLSSIEDHFYKHPKKIRF